MAVDGEDVLRRNLCGLLLSELSAPNHARRSIGPRSVVLIFGVAGGLLVVSVIPIVPSGRDDVASQRAVHEQRVGVRSPRPTEIDLGDALSSRQLATVEHVAVSRVGRRRGCRDVGIGLAVDGAALEPCR